MWHWTTQKKWTTQKIGLRPFSSFRPALCAGCTVGWFCLCVKNHKTLVRLFFTRAGAHSQSFSCWHCYNCIISFLSERGGVCLRNWTGTWLKFVSPFTLTPPVCRAPSKPSGLSVLRTSAKKCRNEEIYPVLLSLWWHFIKCSRHLYSGLSLWGWFSSK